MRLSSPPIDELGWLLPDAPSFTSPSALVELHRFRVYPAGLEFSLEARRAPEPPRDQPLPIYPMLALADPAQRDRQIHLRVTVDGEVVATNERSPARADTDAYELSGGGTSSDQRADWRFWLSPLPAGETAAIEVAWPSVQVVGSHPLRSAALHDAARRTRRLW
jgi:hypothetical protein